MSNWNISLGQDFAADHSFRRFEPDRPSKLKIAADHGVTSPLPYKKYLEAERFPLDLLHCESLGGALPLLLDTAPAEVPRRPLDLAALLAYSIGLSRAELTHQWPLHRVVASARCLYPIDLYAALPCAVGDRIPGGVYYYNPFEHAVERLRGEELWPDLLAACSVPPRFPPRLAVMVSAVFGRTGFKYGDFAYRLCCHEAGMVLGNLLVAAQALGFRAEVRYQFFDQSLHAVLGTDRRYEGTMAVVFLSTGETVCVEPGASGAEVSSPRVDSRSFLPDHWHPGLCQIHQASVLEPGERISQAAQAAEREPSAEPKVVEVPADPGAEGLDLVQVWRERRSGSSPLLTPVLEKLPFQDLSAILRASSRPCQHDLDLEEPSRTPSLNTYFVACRVSDLEQGVYRWDGRRENLHEISVGELRAELHATYNQNNINLFAVPGCFFLAADYDAFFACYGNRGYRLANLEAGRIAQRITLAGEALGWSVRCLDGVDELKAERLLHISRPEQVLYQVPIFRDRNRARFPVPLLI